MIIECLDKTQWFQFAKDAHLIAFNELIDPSMERIDFALMAAKDGVPLGYVTCRETDGFSVYWQFGGAFPGTRQTSMSWLVYNAFHDWCKSRYERVHTLIDNKNKPMLKMAAKIGFEIVGVKVHQKFILLDHLLELNRDH